MSGVDDNDGISSSQPQVRRSTRIRAPSVDVQPLTPSKTKRVGRPRRTNTPTIENEASVDVSDLPKTPSRKTTRRSPLVNENAMHKTSAEVSDLPKTPSRRTTRRSSFVDENVGIDLPKTPSRRTTRRSSFVDENVGNKTPTKLSLTQTETVKTPSRRNTRRSSLAEEPPRVVTPTKRNAKITKEETNDETESNTISRGRSILTPSNSMIVEETEQNEDKVLSPRRTLLKKAIVQIKKCDFSASVETQSESTGGNIQNNSKFLGISLEPVKEEKQEIEKSEKSHVDTQDHEGNENENVDLLNGISFVAFKPSMYSNEKKSPVRYPKTPSALLSKSSPRLLKQGEVEGYLPKRKSLSFEVVTHDAASVTDQSSQNTASASLKEIEQEDVEMTDASIVGGSSTTSPEEERITIETTSNPEKLTEVDLPPTGDVDSLDDKPITVAVQSDCHVDGVAGGDSLIQLDGQKPDNTTDTIRKTALTQCEKEKLNFAEESSLDGFLMQLDTDSIALTNAPTVDKKKEESGNHESSMEDTLVLTEDDIVCTKSPLSQNEKSKNDVAIELSDADLTPIKSSKLETSVDTTKNEAGQEQVESKNEPGKTTEADESLLSFLAEGSDTENLSTSRSSIKLSRLLQRMHNGGEKVQFGSVENVTSKSQSFYEDEYTLSVTQEMEENAIETSGVELNENKTDEPQMLFTEAVMSQENVLEPNSLTTKEAPKLNISHGEKNQCFEAGHDKESFTASKEDENSNEVSHDPMNTSLTKTLVIKHVSIEEVSAAQGNKTDQGRHNSDEDSKQLTSKATPSRNGTEAGKLNEISVEENSAIRTTSRVEASRTVISEISKAEPLNFDKMDTLTEQQDCDGSISFEDVECIMKTVEVLHSGRNETGGVAEQIENSAAVDESMEILANNVSPCTEVKPSSKPLVENNDQADVDAKVYDDSSVNKTLSQSGRDETVDKPELLENWCAVDVSMDTLTNNVSSCTEVNSSSTTVQLDSNLQENEEQACVEAEVHEDSSVNKTLEQLSDSGRNESVDKPELLENSSAVDVSMDTLNNNVSSFTEVISSSTNALLDSNLQENEEQARVEAKVYDDSSIHKTLEHVSDSGRDETVDKPELLENSSTTTMNVSMETLTNNVSSCTEVNSSSTTIQLDSNLQENEEQARVEAEVHEDSSMNKTLEQVSESVAKPELLENSSAVDVSMETLTNNVSSCTEVNSSSTTVQLDSNLVQNEEQARVEAEAYNNSSINKTLEHVSDFGRDETVDKPELLENSSTTTLNVSMETLTNNVSSCTEVNSSPTTVQLDSNLVENVVEADTSMNKTLEHETTLEALNASLDVEVKEMVEESFAVATEFCDETLNNELTHENISLVDTGDNEIETQPETQLENSETEVVENLDRSDPPCEAELENKSIQNQTELEQQDLEQSVVVIEQSKSEESSVQESNASKDEPECSYPIPEEIILVSQEAKQQGSISVSHKEAEELLVQQTESHNEAETVSETAKDFELHVSSDSSTVDSLKQPEVSYPLSPNPTLGVEVEIQEEKIQKDLESESNKEAVLEQAATANEIQEEMNDLTSNNCRNDIIKKDSSIITIESHDENDNDGSNPEKCEIVSPEKRNEIPEHAEDLGSEDTECEEGEEENVNDSFIVSDDAEENITISSEQEYLSFEDPNVAQSLKNIDEAYENVNLLENRTDEQPNNKQNSEEVVENVTDKPVGTLRTEDNNCKEKSDDSSVTTANTDKTNHVDNKDVTQTEDALEPVQSSNSPSSRKTNSNTEADKTTPNKLQLEIEVEVSNEMLQRSIKIDALDTEIGIYSEKTNGTNKGRISIGKSQQKSGTLDKINSKTNEETKEVVTIGNFDKKLGKESIPKISLLQNELGVSSSRSLNKSETKKHKTERSKKHAVKTLDKSERKNDVQKSKVDSEQTIKDDSMKNSKNIKKESSKTNKRKASDLESSTSSIEKRMKLLLTVPTSDIENSSKLISENVPSKSIEISKSKRVIPTGKSVEQPKVTANKGHKQKLKSKNEEKLHEGKKIEKQYKDLRNIACSVKDVSEIVGNNSELTLPNQTVKLNQLETKSSRMIVITSALSENDFKNKVKKQKVVEKNRSLPSNTIETKPTEAINRSKMTENVTANVNSDNVQTKQKKVKSIAPQEDVDHSNEHNKENNGKIATPSGIFKEEMLTPKKVRHAPGFIVTDKTPKAVGFTVKSLVKEKKNNGIGWKIENVQRSLHDIVEPPNTPSGFKSSPIAKPTKKANEPKQRNLLETELSFSTERGRKRKNTNDASCDAPIKIKNIR